MSEHPQDTPADDSAFADTDSFEARISALKGKYDGLFGSSEPKADAAARPGSSTPRPRTPVTRTPPSVSTPIELPPIEPPVVRPAASRPTTGRASSPSPAVRPPVRPTTSTAASPTTSPATGPVRRPATPAPRSASARPTTPRQPINPLDPFDIPDEDLDFPPAPVVRPATPPVEPVAAKPAPARPEEPDLPRLRALLEPEPEPEPTAAPSPAAPDLSDTAGSSLDWLAPELPSSVEQTGSNRLRSRSSDRPADRPTTETVPARRPSATKPPADVKAPVRPTAGKPTGTAKPEPVVEEVPPAEDVPDMIASESSVIAPLDVEEPAAKPAKPAKPAEAPKPAKPAAKTTPPPAGDHPAVSTRPVAKPSGTVAQVKGLTKTYGQSDTAIEALRGVNLTVAAGEFVALVGPSGAGKSSLLYCLAGLIEPTGGTVLVADQDVSTLNDNQRSKLRRDSIATVFEQDNLIPTLTAAENIRLPLQLARRSVDPNWFDRVTATFKLTDVLDRRPQALSTAQQQQVAVARAVMANPSVILADEPTGALDTASAADLLSYLRQAVDELGQTVILATGDAAAASFAHRVVFLVDGKPAGTLDNASAEAVHQGLAHLTQGV